MESHQLDAGRCARHHKLMRLSQIGYSATVDCQLGSWALAFGTYSRFAGIVTFGELGVITEACPHRTHRAEKRAKAGRDSIPFLS